MAAQRPRNRSPKRGRPKSPQASHRRAAEALRARIRSGAWPSGTLLPPLRELAREQGVSLKAIQLALAELKQEQLVKALPRRRLAVVSATWPGVSLERTVLVVVESGLVMVPRDSLLGMLVDGVIDGAAALQAPVTVVHDHRLRKALPEERLSGPLQGVVLLGWKLSPALVARYAKLNVPVVHVDSPGVEGGVHHIGVDNRAGVAEAMERLVALGHRRIAFVQFVFSDPPGVEADSLDRRRAFHAMQKKLGLKSATPCVFSVWHLDAQGGEGLPALLNARPPFTAVLCGDQGAADLLVGAARKMGRAVPRDLSVVSFRSAHEPSPISGPRNDFREMARQGVLLLKNPPRPQIRQRIAPAWFDGETLAPPGR